MVDDKRKTLTDDVDKVGRVATVLRHRVAILLHRTEREGDDARIVVISIGVVDIVIIVAEAGAEHCDSRKDDHERPNLAYHHF